MASNVTRQGSSFHIGGSISISKHWPYMITLFDFNVIYGIYIVEVMFIPQSILSMNRGVKQMGWVGAGLNLARLGPHFNRLGNCWSSPAHMWGRLVRELAHLIFFSNSKI